MTTDTGKPNGGRRRFLKQAALAVAAPAIIGRAAISTAKAAFEGETLIAVSWSGNYEQIFRETIIGPFNEKYGTKAETVGGWDQIVSQIKAAPEDNPPFDVTVAEEYISSAGLAENLYMKTDKSKIPNLSAVYPWFYETRPDKAKEFGVPFGGGTCMLLLRKKLGIAPNSWSLLWDVTASGQLDTVPLRWSVGVRNALDWKEWHPGGPDLALAQVPQPGRSVFLSLEARK